MLPPGEHNKVLVYAASRNNKELWNVDSLFSDELLFDRINHNSQHILQQYLPDRLI